jgi:predicted TIM-barrel fold metal-dependent hydrolase
MKPVGEVEFVNGIAAQSASGQYGKTRVCEAIIGWADLMLGGRVRSVLEAEIAVAGGRFRGVRYGTSWDEGPAGKHVSRPIPRHRLLDPKFREGFAELGKLGLTFDSWHFFPQLPDLLDIARAFPGQAIIVDHVGGHLGVGQYAGKQAETLPVWKKNMQDLAGCPNVVVKLGGLGMTSFGFGFHLRDVPPSSPELAAAWKPYIETCIDLFGPERCMFESNFPPDKQSCGYTELWNAFKIITKGASAAEKTALYSGTAARVYKMIKP